MIITAKLINISSPHIAANIFVVKALEIYSFSKFWEFSTVLLSTVIILYLQSLDLFILHNCAILFKVLQTLSLGPPICSMINITLKFSDI